jgi:anaerobic selenocysteine-containing dehydrogenase
LAKLELLVVIDSPMTDTARHADFVIPTKLPYERHDATHLVDSLLPRPFAQVVHPVMEPPPGVLDDWEVFWEPGSTRGQTTPTRRIPVGRRSRPRVPHGHGPQAHRRGSAEMALESSGLSYDTMARCVASSAGPATAIPKAP